jgi:hypothetical protein
MRDMQNKIKNFFKAANKVFRDKSGIGGNRVKSSAPISEPSKSNDPQNTYNKIIILGHNLPSDIINKEKDTRTLIIGDGEDVISLDTIKETLKKNKEKISPDACFAISIHGNAQKIKKGQYTPHNEGKPEDTEQIIKTIHNFSQELKKNDDKDNPTKIILDSCHAGAVIDCDLPDNIFLSAMGTRYTTIIIRDKELIENLNALQDDMTRFAKNLSIRGETTYIIEKKQGEEKTVKIRRPKTQDDYANINKHLESQWEKLKTIIPEILETKPPKCDNIAVIRNALYNNISKNKIEQTQWALNSASKEQIIKSLSTSQYSAISSPFTWAILGNKPEVLKVILDNGKLSSEDIMKLLTTPQEGDTNSPFTWAILGSKPEVLKVILDNGKLSSEDIMKLLTTPQEGYMCSPFKWAILGNKLEFLKVILDNDKLSNEDIMKLLTTPQEGDTNSPFSLTILDNKPEVLKVILDNGKLSSEDIMKLLTTPQAGETISHFEWAIENERPEVLKVITDKLSDEEIIELIEKKSPKWKITILENIAIVPKQQELDVFNIILDKLSEEKRTQFLKTQPQYIILPLFNAAKELKNHKVMNIISHAQKDYRPEYNQSVLRGGKDKLNLEFTILEKNSSKKIMFEIFQFNISDGISDVFKSCENHDISLSQKEKNAFLYLTQEYALLIDVLKDENTDTKALEFLKDNPLLTHPSALNFEPQLEELAEALFSRSDANNLPENIKEMLKNHASETIQNLYIKNIELPPAEQESILNNENLFNEHDDLSNKAASLLKSQYLDLESANKLFEIHSNNFTPLKDEDYYLLTEQEKKPYDQSESLLKALKYRIDNKLPCKDNWKKFFKDNEKYF